MEYATALLNFQKEIEKRFKRYCVKLCFTHLDDTTFEIVKGRTYDKIIEKNAGSQRVHSFIDQKTGDILKPATYKVPAKHARGNIFGNDWIYAFSGPDDYFIRYLK